MSGEARRAVVVAALIGLAGSAGVRDRADAGRGLASLAGTAEARRGYELARRPTPPQKSQETCRTGCALLSRP
jgi:hypothetical protein